MFITTANTLDTIPGPLRDRMEVIQLAGYTEEEKLQIAKRYLVPRQIERNGLTGSRGSRSPTRALRAIIADYTREAGVRNLEREIGTRLPQGRAPGRRGQRASRPDARSPPERVRELLGPAALLARGASGGPSTPGVATGLAWTPVGGDVLFIEATRDARHGQAHASPASSAT